MELLAAFQSSSFPEVSFHLYVAADVGWVQVVGTE